MNELDLNLKRIAITGPESTGKSWLAQNLAHYFKTSWVPEFSREYLEGLGRTYRFNDIVKIAQGQLEREKLTARQANRYLFCDTDILVTKIWSEFKYNACDPWILEMLKIHRYDLYLLCDIDLPWVADPLREHPDRRSELFALYRQNLTEMDVTWAVISGTGRLRLENAIFAMEQTFGKTPGDQDENE